MSQCIATADPKHEGLEYLRTVVNSFEVPGPHATHIALVYPAMRETLSRFQRRLPDSRIPNYLLKLILVRLLKGLEYLHSKCRIIHTGKLDTSALNALMTYMNYLCRPQARQHTHWHRKPGRYKCVCQEGG